MTPCSDRFTRSTSMDCFSILIFLCIIPMPPSRAMATASLDSVTVSIPALIKGILSLMFFVKYVVVSTSLGITSDLAGTSNTSSNVSPSFTILIAAMPTPPSFFIPLIYFEYYITTNVPALYLIKNDFPLIHPSPEPFFYEFSDINT